MTARERILSPTFALLSAATFCFFLSSASLIPVLPRHLTDLGANSLTVGFVVGSLLLPAVVVRPFVGRQVDRRGRRAFLLAGFAGSVISCLGYGIAPSIPVILAARLLHGVAVAGFYTGSAALVTDITPASRRAQAFSYFSMFLFAGVAAGPALGEHLYLGSGAATAFVAAAAIAAAGLVLALRLREPAREEPQTEAPLLHRAALFPALVLGLTAISLGGSEAFVPLYVTAHGNGDTRLYFATFALTVIVLRFFTGRIADTYGRAAVIIPGTFFCALSMFTLAAGASPRAVVLAGMLLGLGWGALFPGLFALTMDRVPAFERGSATGTFTAAFDLSFSGGQILLGMVLQLSDFGAVFSSGGMAALAAGIAFLARRRRSNERFPPVSPAAC